MPEALLQQLLDARHFSLDGDDAHFERLTAAAKTLQGELATRPADIIRAVLLGLDPEAPEDDPLFDVAEKVLKNGWKTLRNHYKERPRTILQAILLDACHQVALARPRSAAIAWLTAVDAIPMFPSTPLHEVIATNWLELGRMTETLALGANAAARSEPAKSPEKAAFKLPARKGKPHSSEHYSRQILQAAGPYAGAEPQNPYHPHNQPQHWAQEFANRMSPILVKVEEVGVDTAETRIAEVTATLQSQFEAYMQAMDGHLQASTAAQKARVEAVRTQQDALWWSQALYSPSLRRSYRALAPEAAALVMALDLANLVAMPAPASVVHLLGETVARLPGASFVEADRHCLGTVIERLALHGKDARVVAGRTTAPRGRVSLLAFLELAVHGEKVEGLCLARTGISPERSVHLPDLAMMLFRAAQARALAEAA